MLLFLTLASSIGSHLRATWELCLSVCLHLLFCHLLKKSPGNPYLKICDLTQYFFADAPMKKN